MTGPARPKFSVVIDSFNYARFIGQAIDSVFGQKDVDPGSVELIVVDDGSTDDTVEVVKRYGDRLTLIIQKNAGQAAAFATGFAAAKGEIVCLLDSDDYWAPGKLAAVGRAMEDPGVALAQNLQRDVDVEGRPLPNPLPDWPKRYTADDLTGGRFVNAATSSIAVRRSVLDAILPVPKEFFYLHDDYLLMFGVQHGAVANLAEILGFHRVHGANNSMVLGHPARLERFIREKRAFRPLLEAELAKRGRALSERYRTVEDLDLLRRELLLHAWKGERRAAWGKWLELRRYPGGLTAFRAATLLIALASPALYLALYQYYGEHSWLAKLRKRALPEPKS